MIHFSNSLILCATLLFGCGALDAHHPAARDAPAAVRFSTAHEEQLDTLYHASGTVRGRTTALLTSKTTGYVRSVEVLPGARVRAGQVLATLEANDSSASARRARAGLAQSLEAQTEAENSLRAAQAALRIAQSTHDRLSSLFASHAIPLQELDEARARLQGAEAEAAVAAARLRSSGSRIDQATAEVSEAQATLDYSRISAPFDGQVIERRIDPGNLASPGMPLLVVEQAGTLRVETAVEESRAATVSVGDQTSVEIEALAQPVLGTVSEVVPTIDTATRAFAVKVDLPANLVGLRPGMFARVAFRVGTSRRLVVPSSAITPLGALDRVFATDGDHLRLRMVSLGEVQGPWTEVLSGLSAGERVVQAPTSNAHDGLRFTEQP